MISVEFKHVPLELLHQSAYELVVMYQHGDYDGFAEKTLHYPSSERDELSLDVLLLITVETNGGSIDECDGLLAGIIEAQGIEDDLVHDVAEAWKDKFYTADMLNIGEERAAAIVGHEIYYYDGDGARLGVETHINGRKVK